MEITDDLATYAELLIGVQQAGSMTELYMRISNILFVCDFKNHPPEKDRASEIARLTSFREQTEKRSQKIT